MEEELLYFKACPHCATGTVEATEQWDGRYFRCLNCGFILEVPAITSIDGQTLDLEDRNLEPVA